jgi:small-conductance mechanosensitive channel
MHGLAVLAVVGVVQDPEAAAGGDAVMNLLRGLDVPALLRSAAWLFVGIPVVLAFSRWVQGWVTRNATPQRGLVVGKALWYAGLLAIFVTVLLELGFSLTPLLGAAGILGVALGFASQTSVSNVISGFFLMAEQPFVVGDLVEVGSHTGFVQSIDMISVKLRTFDNRFIRIPNETLVKSEMVNVTRFPIRRVNVTVGVAYKEDLDRVREVLLQVARDNPLCLMEPEPVLLFRTYGESSLDFLFGVWATQENYFTLKDRIQRDVKRAFDEAGIEIPFPHRTLYTGADTDAFPVRIVAGDDGGRGGRMPSPDPAPDPRAGEDVAGEDAPGTGERP